MSVISLHIQVSLDIQCIENFKYSLSSYPIKMPREWQVSFYQDSHIPMYVPDWSMSNMQGGCLESLEKQQHKRIKFWHLSSLNYYIFMNTCLSFYKKIYWTQSILSQSFQGFFPPNFQFPSSRSDLKGQDRSTHLWRSGVWKSESSGYDSSPNTNLSKLKKIQLCITLHFYSFKKINAYP